MLDLDSRSWLRTQRRGAATPFPQLAPAKTNDDEMGDWLLEGTEDDKAPRIERNLALLQAGSHRSRR